jgi:MFS family permease
LGGALVGAVLAVLLPVVPNIAVLVIVWAVLGVAVGLAQGPTLTTVADRVPKEHIGRVSIVSGLLSYGAAIFGLVIAGVLFNAIGLGAYAPFAVVMLISAVLFVLIARDKSSKEMSTSRLRVSTVLLSFVTALGDRDYRWAWIAKTFLWVGYGISTVYGVYMLQGYIVPALSASQAATIAPLISAAGVPAALVAMVISGRWSDKIGRRKPFVVAAALVMATSYLVPFAWPSITAMIVQSVIASFGFGMFLVVDQALFIEILPDRNAAGRDLGLSQLGANLGQAIGPIIAGIVVAVFAGSYGPVWVAASVLVLISAFAVLPIKRVR